MGMIWRVNPRFNMGCTFVLLSMSLNVPLVRCLLLVFFNLEFVILSTFGDEISFLSNTLRSRR